MTDKYSYPPVYKWTVGLLVTMGTFMALLDTTIVIICLPKMMASLNADLYDIQWVIIAYLIASAITIPTVAWLTKLLGAKRVYLLGMAIFIITSIVCGQARNIEGMIIARILQGMGEGLIVPIALI
ncbi:MAG: MFS transporter, partial [Deltaproteobacteria bacterium]|nr:MFS transporter [Deltaproteobacteria bacterium]